MPSGKKFAAARRHGLDAANGEKNDSKFQIQDSRGHTFQWARLKCETAITHDHKRNSAITVRNNLQDAKSHACRGQRCSASSTLQWEKALTHSSVQTHPQNETVYQSSGIKRPIG
ncbi:MAG: hypothetical protein ACRD5G_14970 [Candidatus Acidiferrales bacterium]